MTDFGFREFTALSITRKCTSLDSLGKFGFQVWINPASKINLGPVRVCDFRFGRVWASMSPVYNSVLHGLIDVNEEDYILIIHKRIIYQ